MERGTCYHTSHSEFITGTIVVTGSLEKAPDQLDGLLLSHGWNCSHHFLAMGTALPVCTHGDDRDRCDRVRFELQEGMDSTLHGTESSLFHLRWEQYLYSIRDLCLELRESWYVDLDRTDYTKFAK